MNTLPNLSGLFFCEKLLSLGSRNLSLTVLERKKICCLLLLWCLTFIAWIASNLQEMRRLGLCSICYTATKSAQHYVVFVCLGS